MSIEDEIKNLIALEMESLIKEHNLESEKIFNTREAAEYLRISRDWLYKNLNKIPHVDIGGYKFLKSQLDLYVKNKINEKNNVKVSITNVKGKGCQYKVK